MTAKERINPPKILKVRTILSALYNRDIAKFPESHGEVQARMKHTLANNIDWEYEQALRVFQSLKASRNILTR
jgi:hypothetical protein